MAAKTPANARLRTDMGSYMESPVSLLVDDDATFYKGEFCRQANDGLVYEAITGANSGVGDDAFDIVALETVAVALTVNTTTKKFARIHRNCVFEMNEVSDVIERTDIGQWFDMTVDSNLDSVNSASGSHAVFECIDLGWLREPLMNKSTDTLANLYVKVLGRTLDAARTN